MTYKKLVSTVRIDHDDWLKYRRMGIGGSDAGAIMGFNPYKGRFGVYVNKKLGYDEDLTTKEAVYWGNVLEDVVAAEFERRTGKKVRRVNAILQSADHPFMLANLDREVVGEDAILECKTTSQYCDKEWVDDEVPAQYLCQVQHYLAVTGAKKAYIACLIGGQKFVYKEIDRDDDFIAFLICAERDFWDRYIVGDEEPPTDGTQMCSDYLRSKYPEDDGDVAVLTSEAEKMADLYLDLDRQIDVLNHQKDGVKNGLIKFMESASRAIGNGCEISYKSVDRSNIDMTKLKADHPDLYKEYLKTTTTRRFILKEAK